MPDDIKHLLAEIDPEWEATAQRMAADGYSNEEIVEHFMAEARKEIDSLLDLYNALKPREGER